jgi:exopolysaccharide biosynthesis predicted pyruvyltransferase EpsI
MERGNFMEIHNLYYEFLNRPAEKEVLDKNPDTLVLADQLQRSLEHKIVKRISSYFKGHKDSFYEFIFHNYVFMLNYLPPVCKLMTYECWEKEDSLNTNESFNTNDSFFKVKEDVLKNSDYIYLEECRKHFYSLSERTNNPKKIKFYGPVGISGYAKICREMCNVLKDDIHFSPIQFHNYNKESFTEDNIIEGKKGFDDSILSSLVPLAENKYDYIVLHSTPELWPTICKYERSLNPDVYIYGISVWETDDIPIDWITYIQHVDKISTPSNFSSKSFKKYFSEVETVYHPIPSNTFNPSTFFDFGLKKLFKDNYVFYNISEWSNRKGLSELIKVYFKTFSDENVLLYIKSCGDIKEEEALSYIKKCKEQSNSNAKIILNYDKVCDVFIESLHCYADCYISTCKSEGHGIGACQALTCGNHVIITGYGGQTEYLGNSRIIDGINIDFINYTMEPSTFCTVWSKKHQGCGIYPHCKFFNYFVPCQHSWAKVDETHCSELMYDAFLKHKSNMTKIVSGMNLDFKEHFLKSLYSTTHKAFNLPIIPKKNWQPQNELIHFETHKNILLLNSSSYGNVGDDLYTEMIKRYLCEYNITVVPDTYLMNSKKELIGYKDWDDEKDVILDFDHLIIGGGGLFNKSRMIENHPMVLYTRFAKKYKKPYYILSVGFQDLEIQKEDVSDYTLFHDIFSNSSYTSVRSIVDYSLVKTFLNKDKINSLNYYPDLVYSLKKVVPFNNNIVKKEKKYLLLVFSHFFSLNWSHIRVQIHKLLHEKNLNLVVMNWDGNIDNNKIIIDKEYNICMSSFKNVKFFRGLNKDFSFNELFDILSNTEIILPGRYHAKVLAHVFKIPHIIGLNYNNYKFKADVISNGDTSKSLEPLIKIKDLIYNTKILNYSNWDEEQRNNAIVKIHQNTDIDIPFLQNWDNFTLEENLERCRS